MVPWFFFYVNQPTNTNKDPLHVSNGPTIMSKMKAFKEALKGLVLQVLAKEEIRDPLEHQEGALVHLIYV